MGNNVRKSNVNVAALNEESKDLENQSEQKLLALRKIKVTEVAKKSNFSTKNMYHETFLFKILGMIDFYSSLSRASPASLAFVQKFADPQRLNLLIQLLMGCLTKGKIIILRIIQDLMKLDFPFEILDHAIDVSV